MAVLSNLRPEKVFYYFEKLCSVPHGSGNTKQISDLCVGFAKELGLKYRQEACNNVIIWKNGSCGYENAAPIILQGHIDMVCAKTEDCTKDMTRDGLDVRTDGEWVWADKTSLGGDNGIAVAMILAILSDETLPHPPIEAVFTVDEEVGMYGAFALDCSDLKGKKLLNLDSEEEGVFTVSCAGGVRLDCALELKQLLTECLRVDALLEHQIVHRRLTKILLEYLERLLRHLIGQVLGGVHPLARIVAGLLLNHIDPMSLNGSPLAVNIMAPLVLDRRQTIGLHVASEKLLAVLRYTSLEHKDARSHTHAKKQVFRQLDDLAQTMILQNALHLRLRCFLQLLVWQDERALGMRRNAV